MSGTTNSALIWSIAELLRGDYKQSEYGRVILPFTLLRRLDCWLAPSRETVWRLRDEHKDSGLDLGLHLAEAAADYDVQPDLYNVSPWDFGRLVADPHGLRENLLDFVNGFNESAREIFTRLEPV